MIESKKSLEIVVSKLNLNQDENRMIRNGEWLVAKKYEILIDSEYGCMIQKSI
jgi:hypothetical protein